MATALFLLSPKEAYVSQVFMEDLTLKELVNISSIIVIAKKALPFHISEKIDITPPGKAKDKKHYPEFVKSTYNFEVVKVIYEKEDEHERGLIKKGTKIKVSPSEQDFNFEMHKNYYIDGVRKSWEERNYSTSADFNNSQELILFLKVKDRNNYLFIVNNSYETSDREKEILDILKRMF